MDIGTSEERAPYHATVYIYMDTVSAYSGPILLLRCSDSSSPESCACGAMLKIFLKISELSSTKELGNTSCAFEPQTIYFVALALPRVNSTTSRQEGDVNIWRYVTTIYSHLLPPPAMRTLLPKLHLGDEMWLPRFAWVAMSLDGQRTCVAAYAIELRMLQPMYVVPYDLFGTSFLIFYVKAGVLIDQCAGLLRDWKKQHAGFHPLYYFIVDTFEDPKDEVAKTSTIELLQWWNRYVYVQCPID